MIRNPQTDGERAYNQGEAFSTVGMVLGFWGMVLVGLGHHLETPFIRLIGWVLVPIAAGVILGGVVQVMTSMGQRIKEDSTNG